MTVSWLELERYALAELPAADAARVEAAIAADATLQKRLAEIRGDARPMPRLPAPKVVRPARWKWLAVAPVLAAAAAFVLYLQHDQVPPARRSVKGGELALFLVREHEGNVATTLAPFTTQDRFKAYLTCPPGERGYRFFVFQGNNTSEALSADVPCGNQVPLEGAFRLTTTEPAWACVARIDHFFVRLTSLPWEAVCVDISRNGPP